MPSEFLWRSFLSDDTEGKRSRPCPRLFPNCIYVRCPLFACCCCDVDVGPLVKDSRRLGPRSVLFSPPGSSRPDAKIRHCSEMNHPKDDSYQVDRGSSRRRDVVRAPLRSVSCETHENSCAKTLVVRFRFTSDPRLIVTGNLVHR